jgi:hypothetical protein
MEHSAAIDWPNGEGYTPCTPDYAAAMTAREEIYDPNYDEGSLEDLSREEYEEWHNLNDKLHAMQANGHLGTPVRF